MNSEILSFAGVVSSELIDQMYHPLFLEHIAVCSVYIYNIYNHHYSTLYAELWPTNKTYRVSIVKLPIAPKAEGVMKWTQLGFAFTTEKNMAMYDNIVPNQNKLSMDPTRTKHTSTVHLSHGRCRTARKFLTYLTWAQGEELIIRFFLWSVIHKVAIVNHLRYILRFPLLLLVAGLW